MNKKYWIKHRNLTNKQNNKQQAENLRIGDVSILWNSY